MKAALTGPYRSWPPLAPIADQRRQHHARQRQRRRLSVATSGNDGGVDRAKQRRLNHRRQGAGAVAAADAAPVRGGPAASDVATSGKDGGCPSQAAPPQPPTSEARVRWSPTVAPTRAGGAVTTIQLDDAGGIAREGGGPPRQPSHRGGVAATTAPTGGGGATTACQDAALAAAAARRNRPTSPQTPRSEARVRSHGGQRRPERAVPSPPCSSAAPAGLQGRRGARLASRYTAGVVATTTAPTTACGASAATQVGDAGAVKARAVPNGSTITTKVESADGVQGRGGGVPSSPVETDADVRRPRANDREGSLSRDRKREEWKTRH